jgi:hypothetical protein
VSEAVLCAGERAPDVIAWAYVEQDRIRAAAKTDPTAAAKIVAARFPELAACVGSPEAKSRLNKSLRWAVANNIRVLTPQLFVDNVKLCDEDVDLGLAYTLGVMLERHASKTLIAAPTTAPPAAVEPPLEAAKPTTAEPGATPTAPTGDPTAPAATGPATPTDPATPPTEAAKPAATEPAKPATEPAKPAAEPAKPADPAGPVTSPGDPPAKPTPTEPPPEPPAPTTPPADPAPATGDTP